MFKKLILFSTIAVLGGCETINQASQCDPEKNYLISNPQAMEEYKALRKSNEVQSYYYMAVPPTPCYNNICVTYDKKLSYIELFFNDKERKGIYTIKGYENEQGRNCMDEDPITKNRKIKCYEVIKNENEEVKSRYKYIYDKTKKGQTIISFYDSRKNVKLYEYSYQIYSTSAIGGPGFSTCKTKDNNPNYRFNPVSFPIDD